MNTNSMQVRRVKRIDTRWPQTDLMPRRAMRQADSPYARKQRPPINWGRCLMVAGAAFLVMATMLYKFTGPA